MIAWMDSSEQFGNTFRFDRDYLNKQRTRDLGSVTNDLENAGTPKPPFDAIINGPK